MGFEYGAVKVELGEDLETFAKNDKKAEHVFVLDNTYQTHANNYRVISKLNHNRCEPPKVSNNVVESSPFFEIPCKVMAHNCALKCCQVVAPISQHN